MFYHLFYFKNKRAVKKKTNNNRQPQEAVSARMLFITTRVGKVNYKSAGCVKLFP